MQLKPPTTFDKQLDKLAEHNIKVPSKDHCKAVLSYNNYYRLSGYALQYRIDPNNSDCVPGTSFDEILKIYQFDSKLRCCLREYIEIAEVYYRTQISYCFAHAKCSQPPHDQHYDVNNYYFKKGFKEIIDSFGRQRFYYKDSLIIKHHKSKYGNRLPLWAIVELLSFSDLSKLYSAMYYSEQNLIANAIGTGPIMLKNHLHCLSVLRNKCAHAARLYNTEFNPPAQFPSTFLKKNPNIANNTLFAYILVLIKRLPDNTSRMRCVRDIVELVDNRPEGVELKLMGFPDDWATVLRAL